MTSFTAGTVDDVVGSTRTSISRKTRSPIVFRSDSMACRSPNGGVSNGALAAAMPYPSSHNIPTPALKASAMSDSTLTFSAMPTRNFKSPFASA